MSEEQVKIGGDFGFSFHNEEDLKRPEKEQLTIMENDIASLRRKLYSLKETVWPLLEGLKKDPYKKHIEWPNRVEKINELMGRIDAIVKE